MSDKLFIKGTLILTLTGLVSRLMGFFYRIFLSHTIGAQGVGIYQLPVHAIVLAACCMGIQAAISRLCASFTALGKEKESRDALLLGTFLSMALCGLLSFLVYWNADFVASALLKEPRTTVLLRILAFSFPFAALHSCVNSFYYARKTTGIPAFILLLEQTSRIGSTYVIYLILISQKKEITPVIATGGALFSELTATAACMLALGLDFSRENYKPAARLLRRILRVFSRINKGTHRNSPSAVKYISHIQPASAKNNTATSINALIKEIVQIAVPHSVNRLLLTLLSGIEMVLIPQRLLLAGINRTDSLSVYGIFTGMALPLILFPATLTKVAYGATTTENVVTYTTYLNVDNADLLLRPGMTASATVTTAERRNVLLVPNSALRFTPRTSAVQDFSGSAATMFMPRGPHNGSSKRVKEDISASQSVRERTVYILRNGDAVPVSIKTGLTDGTRTEVISGDLKDGDQVVVDQQRAKS